MSHPATIHNPLTVPAAAQLLDELEAAAALPDEASAPFRDVLAQIVSAFREGRLFDAGHWLIALHSNASGDWEYPGQVSDYWWRGRTTDDPLQLLAEAFGELTLGITMPYWEIALPGEETA